MKHLFLGALIGAFSLSALAADPIEGKWQTIDDKTKKKRAVVEIKAAGGGFDGTIIGLAEGIDPNCGQCADSEKGKPLIGRTILKGVKKQPDGTYAEGQILDPENGKSYRSTAKLLDGGKKLAARGHLGPFGRTQTWERIE